MIEGRRIDQGHPTSGSCALEHTSLCLDGRGLIVFAFLYAVYRDMLHLTIYSGHRRRWWRGGGNEWRSGIWLRGGRRGRNHRSRRIINGHAAAGVQQREGWKKQKDYQETVFRGFNYLTLSIHLLKRDTRRADVRHRCTIRGRLPQTCHSRQVLAKTFYHRAMGRTRDCFGVASRRRLERGHAQRAYISHPSKISVVLGYDI